MIRRRGRAYAQPHVHPRTDGQGAMRVDGVRASMHQNGGALLRASLHVHVAECQVVIVDLVARIECVVRRVLGQHRR